ncbi:MAG: hypothetical protein HP496_12920 [Nitrospira sp.]|nr:hypothetical protein [Nitrospira sp.]
MKARPPIATLLGLVALLIQPILFGWSGGALAEGAKGLETVRGNACYRFGDEETPAKARRGAIALAQEQAIRSHRVFVESSTRVKNFQMEEDLIQTASAAMLQEMQISRVARRARGAPRN